MLRCIDGSIGKFETEGIRHVLGLEHLHSGLLRVFLYGGDKCFGDSLSILHRTVFLFDLGHELFGKAAH